MSAFNIFLFIHILSGFISLISGLVPMATRPGSKRHVRFGKVYYWAMFAVFVTAVSMCLIKPNPFLFSIGIFSFYLAYSGVRIVRVKNKAASIGDKAVAILMIVTSLFMLLVGSGLLMPAMGGTIILLTFGAIGFLLGFQDLKLAVLPQKDPSSMKWFFSHAGRMGGAYISTFTAFVVTNVHFLPPLVAWLGPSVIGTFLIARVIRKYKKKFAQARG